jgi:Fe-S oxidoreductase
MGGMKSMLRFLDEINSCAQCNYCRICPAYTVEKWESVSPRGRLYMLKLLLQGHEIDTVMLKNYFKCTLCGLCESVCTVDLPLHHIWEETRNRLGRIKGYLPAHRKLADNIAIQMNIYGEDKSMRAGWLPEGVEISDSEILFFAGCTASYRVNEIAESAARIFSFLGVEFNYLGVDEVCCGSTLLRTGQRERAKKLVHRNIKLWEDNRIESVITACSGCYRTFAIDYPRLCEDERLDFNFEILHLSQFLEREVGGAIKNDMEKLVGKASYHDPCHLGRHSGIYDEPRKLIRTCGLELLEMEHSRENSLCCGAGGGVRAQFRDLSLEIANLRLKEALELGVDYLVSCCPFCKMHLSHAKNVFFKNEKTEILDISELVARVLEEG